VRIHDGEHAGDVGALFHCGDFIRESPSAAVILGVQYFQSARRGAPAGRENNAVSAFA